MIIPDSIQLLECLGTAGNLVIDAHMAAQAIDHGAVLHTADAELVGWDAGNPGVPTGLWQ